MVNILHTFELVRPGVIFLAYREFPSQNSMATSVHCVWELCQSSGLEVFDEEKYVELTRRFGKRTRKDMECLQENRIGLTGYIIGYPSNVSIRWDSGR